MKTVQEVLKELDTEELVTAFLERVPITPKVMYESEVSAQELLINVRIQIEQFIDRMRTLPIKKGENTGLLFAFETIKEFYKENAYALVHIEELKEKGLEAESYAYEFTDQEEIAGFLVSDTKRTQKDLIGLMVDVLFEASFFGFKQERLNEEKEELNRRIEETKSPDFVGIPAEKAFEDLYKEFGIEKEIETEEEKAIRNVYNKAMIDYNNFLYKKALQEVIETVFNK